jgi:chemotaxis protein histidine kinase CheA
MDAVLEPPYLNWLNNELTVLSSMLGEKFVNSHRTMVLSEEQADGVQHLADCILQDIPIDREEPDTKNLLIELVTARKGSLKEAIRSFDRFIDQAASKTNKLVNPIRINGDDVQLDTQLIRHLKDAMVHVVSNAVIHGIEPPDERLDEGKALEGSISVTLKQHDGLLEIDMADDGAGINLDGLKRVAVTRGLYTKEQANALDKDGLLELIFTDNVSTAEEVSQYAGRGVGLAAVRSILQKQGGNITVSTEPKKGTCFTFIVPLSSTSAKSNDREDHD